MEVLSLDGEVTRTFTKEELNYLLQVVEQEKHRCKRAVDWNKSQLIHSRTDFTRNQFKEILEGYEKRLEIFRSI